MTIKLYSKPGCQPCRLTELALHQRGVIFQKIDVTEDHEAFAFVTQQLGLREMPVVYASETNFWPGFQPDRIKALPAPEGV